MTPDSPAARRRVRALATALAVAGTLLVALPAAASAADYAPNRIVVDFAAHGATAHSARAGGRSRGVVRVVMLRRGTSVRAALITMRHRPGVRWALPDYIAHATTDTAPSTTVLPPPFVPNDPGISHTAGGWAGVQWNFTGPFGVNAEQAWGNLISDGAPGGRGVTVAVLDTGVAYRNWGRFTRSPDLGSTQFVRGYDFITPGAYPVDHNGHGTHVASTIAESTNNGVGLAGLAYGVRIMPVRVLNGNGEGDASVIARGIRYAVDHGAQVINLSLEFDPGVTASDIPLLISAINYAHRRGVVVVAAAGNENADTAAYPARARYVIAVGATTQHGCLANYSDYGPRVTIVAPGGGTDARISGDPNCQPDGPAGGDIYQVTFLGTNPRRFGIPLGYDGTSMAAPHVSATAALIIASRVLGAHPSPDAILHRLLATATHLGDPADAWRYGGGLVNAAAATAPGGPGAVVARARGRRL